MAVAQGDTGSRVGPRLGRSLPGDGRCVAKKLYGRFPVMALGGPDDSGSRGVWIPTIGLDQYGATLARWFGVDSAGLAAAFPNLSKFPPADLGIHGVSKSAA